jgi:hypothetical protein
VRTRILISITLAASVLILGPNVFAKTASCPCSPCKCSPCTCGAGGSKGGKHHEKGGHEHGGVGVGVNVDLGGVGQRKAEPNPFGTTNQPSTSTTHEKTPTKHPGQSTATTFDKIDLTSEKAKDLEQTEEEAGTPSGTINVSDEKGETAPAPPPETQEKKKKYKFPTPWVTPQTQEKPKKHDFPTPWVTPQTQEKGPKKWPDPIQDWVDKEKAAADAEDKMEKAFKHFTELNQNKPYTATNEGGKEFNDAYKAANEARAAADEAGKNIDQATKDTIFNTDLKNIYGPPPEKK